MRGSRHTREGAAVAASGGVLLNRVFAESLRTRLGGLALGQAALASQSSCNN